MGVVWIILGDMDFLSTDLFFEGASWISMCPWCRANKIESEEDAWASMFDVHALPFNDFSDDAPWRGTIWRSRDEWLAAHGGIGIVHPFFSIGYLSILSVLADILHIMELGIDHYICGSVFWLMCYTDRYFRGIGTPTDRCKELWHRIVRQYQGRDTPVQLNTLTVSLFADESGPYAHVPCLSGRVKAAATRHLVPIILSIWLDVRDPHNEDDNEIAYMLACLDRFYTIVADEPYRMNDAQVEEARQCIRGILQTYANLASKAYYAVPRKLLWHTVPKHHYAEHIADQCSVGNPRYAWTYQDEDFMGLIKIIGESCTIGTQSWKIAKKLLKRWVFGVSYRTCRWVVG